MKSLCGNDPRRHRTSTSRHKKSPEIYRGIFMKNFLARLRSYIVNESRCAVKSVSGHASGNINVGVGIKGRIR